MLSALIRGDSNKDTQRTFMLKKIEKIPNMLPDLANFPCLEHILLVTKLFEPLKVLLYFVSYIIFSNNTNLLK